MSKQITLPFKKRPSKYNLISLNLQKVVSDDSDVWHCSGCMTFFRPGDKEISYFTPQAEWAFCIIYACRVPNFEKLAVNL